VRPHLKKGITEFQKEIDGSAQIKIILAMPGRDQEDHGWKPAWANSSVRPSLKNSFRKIELVEWSGSG
jgi:hypothetical protein